MEEPGAPGGYYPNQMEGVGVEEDPRLWRHQCQVQGSPMLGDTALRSNCLVSVKRNLLEAGWGSPLRALSGLGPRSANCHILLSPKSKCIMGSTGRMEMSAVIKFLFSPLYIFAETFYYLLRLYFFICFKCACKLETFVR